MKTNVRPSGIFLFNIIPIYRPGLSRVFDYARHKYQAASLPSSGQRIKQNTLFSDLENQCGTCLADLDLLYVFATDGDRDFARINWKSPGNFTASEVNSPTFTTNEGFQGDGSTSYLNTGWDPTNNGSNYTQNEGGWLVHVNNEITPADERCFGGGGAGLGSGNISQGRTTLQPKNSASNYLYSVNSLSLGAGSQVSSIGFFHGIRALSTSTSLYKDGTEVHTDASNSNGLTEADFLLCAYFDNATPQTEFSDAEISIFGIGASLTGKESALYTAWNTYFTSL